MTNEKASEPIWFGGIPFVKKGTTGCAGGKKEFHLWMEKENLQ